MDVTSWECERGSERKVVPIGKPIANTQTYILDERMQVVQVGVAGELYLAGAGLARGYMKRAALTAEKFIPNPFSTEPGARMYKTGDLARYLPDGNVEYLGRIDFQVKVRGFRIELGEIEAALVLHPSVREAVVVAREDEAGDKRLMAYVVAHQGEESPSVGELQSFLKSKLPEYMVPALFMTLDALPLNSNGKVDRRALPEPDRSRPQLAKEYVAPRTPLEQWLTDMLKKILGLEQIGVHDNFFELGGDSIKGAVFINRLQEALGQYVYVVAIFDAPTIAQLAVYLTENYLEAVARLFGAETLPANEASGERIDEAKVEKLRQAMTPLPPREMSAAESVVKNRPAIFVLSPPRSGSTLLRVMLAGHPQLFAPPELELLSFNTLEERRAAFTGRNSFSLEGTLRALMELKGCNVEEAKQIMGQYEDEGLTTREFYALLQEWIGERLLVDKTPSYALDRESLKRAESDFDQARYIHLVRHPSAMILSFEEARLDQVFFRHEHDFGRRELAELIWVVSQQNILDFLSEVPAERQHLLQFEELLREPRRVMERLCEFLGIEFTEAMIEPYRDKERRMTDGIHPESKMHGDMKFHEHQGIDAATAERWKEKSRESELGEITLQLARRLGYETPEVTEGSVEESIEGEEKSAENMEAGGEGSNRKTPRRSKSEALVEIQAGDARQPFFCVHPLGGNVLCYFDLARHLGADQTFYGLQAHGLNDGEETQETRVEAIAAHYIEALRGVQPEGPYALGGWSMGGVVAFEMAQQLQAQGEKIAMLALLDSFAPKGKPGPIKIDERRALARFAFNLGLTLSQLTIPLDEIAQLEPDRQLAYVMGLAQSSKIVPTDMTLQYFRRLFEVFKTNIRAVRGYEPQPYSGRITLFRARDRVVKAGQNRGLGWGQNLLRGIKKNLHARDAQAQSKANGWASIAAEGVEVCDVPGDHYTMLKKPNVEALAEQLRTHLDQAQVAELVV
ncbi:MAG TPA: sulfotransferase [Pyrinomonadaceae bacterium]